MLTTFLKEKDVRERFRQEFKMPEFSCSKPLLAPPLSKRYSFIGTACDYLIRFKLKHLNPQSIERRPWVAESALESYENDADILSIEEKEYFQKAKSIVANAKRVLAEFFRTGEISDALLKSALELDSLDPVARSGNAEKLIGVYYEEDIEELRSLSKIIKEQDFKSCSVCLLNPAFGSASELVGGADADLLIDETLIDIKTTKELKMERSFFDQIIGYYVLHELGSIGDLKPKAKISNLALYYSRYGHIQRMQVSDIINPNSFPDFLNWFKSRAGTYSSNCFC